MFESKMALFLQIAETPSGASCLVDNLLVESLASMHVFQCRPEHQLSGTVRTFLPFNMNVRVDGVDN